MHICRSKLHGELQFIFGWSAGVSCVLSVVGLLYLALLYDTSTLVFLRDFSDIKLHSPLPLVPPHQGENPKYSPMLPGWWQHPSLDVVSS